MMMGNILHLTTVHPRFELRIHSKEAQTLAIRLRHKVVVMVADGKGNIEGQKGDVSIEDLGLLGRSRLARILIGSGRAFSAIRRMRATIVHFHDPELIPLGIFLKISGCKVIYDVHEDVPRQILSKYWLPLIIRKPIAWGVKCFEWLGGMAFDAIIPATDKIAEKFPTIKTVTIQNFPISAEISDVSRTLYGKRQRSFVYAGVIATIRGIAEVVRAFEYLKDIPGLTLQLAGEFSPPSLENALRGFSGWAAVNYHGWLSRKEVGRLLGGARAGLVTHHPVPNEVDAQPIKMFEYMGAGLPVIASDFPALRRIIDEAGCGLLVDPLNPRAIADAMRWILDHPTEAEAMGRRGFQAVKSTYNWDTEATKIVNLYKKLLAR